MILQLQRDARDIFAAGLAAVDAFVAVTRHLAFYDRGTKLRIDPMTFDVNAIRGVRVVAAGKAAGPMILAAESVLGPLLRGGVSVTKRGALTPTRIVSLLEAGHPLPDAGSLEAGRRVYEVVSSMQADEVLLVLLSGGASSLLEVLPPDVTLDDLRALTELLLRSGAPIEEVNTVRRALSRVKAGGLLQALPLGVKSAVLVVSDVLGSPLDMIGSGPMMPVLARAGDAMRILAERDLLSTVSSSIQHALRDATRDAGSREQALRARAEYVTHCVVADNQQMAEAAADMARQRGYHTLLLSTFVEGEAKDVGTFMAGLAKEVVVSDRPVKKPACIIGSGETTVTVRGTGRGGRNQEMALSFAIHAAALPHTLLLCGASDGTDGPTDAAGALADGQTTMRAQALGLDARAMLANNDAYRYFETVGDLIVSGPTGTNTNDLYILLVG